ncbi:hypothetical protein ABTX35_28130, partial [Streptomyces sp. NPDC096080]
PNTHPLPTKPPTPLVCPQQPALLPGTLGDNLGALSDDPAATAEAARAALADQVVDAAPHGADTSVGAPGPRPASGQGAEAPCHDYYRTVASGRRREAVQWVASSP